MKTLIISGVYTRVGSCKYTYSVALYGQLGTVVTLICMLEHVGDMSTLTETAKVRYCNHFQTNDFNLIILDSLWMTQPLVIA